MLWADEWLGRCSKILSDSCAAERSSASATNGCARSAVAKYCFAIVSWFSLATMVGIRGCAVFTVASCAHPHHPKIDNANAMFFHDFIVRLEIRFERARATCNGR